MPKAVSAREAQSTFDLLLGWVVEQQDVVIIAGEEEPAAVIMPFARYEAMQLVLNGEAGEDPLITMRRLRTQIGARNPELTDRDVEEIAERFSRDVIEGLVEKDQVRFEPVPTS